MNRIIPLKSSIVTLVALIASVLSIAACERSASAPSSTPSAATPGATTTFTPAPTVATTPADQTYTVRGLIDRMPDPSGKQGLAIHHEAIPTFVGKSGQVTGMHEMIMDFAWLAPGVSLDGLKEGDAISFTFEVRWKSEPRSLITTIVKLPPGTKLTIQPAK